MRVPRAAFLLAATAAIMTGARSDVLEGNPASAVKVVIYEDLQCGDCLTFRAMLDEKLLPKYGARVAFQHRDFPLGRHDWARMGAIAARWVSEHNAALGITFRRELLSQQNSVTQQNLKPWLLEFASRNNLDQKGILDSLTDARLIGLVDQDMQSAKARGVSKIPAVFIGGVAFAETILYDDLARAIDEAIK